MNWGSPALPVGTRWGGPAPGAPCISGCSGPSVEVASRQVTSGPDPARGSASQTNLVLLPQWRGPTPENKALVPVLKYGSALPGEKGLTPSRNTWKKISHTTLTGSSRKVK